MSLVIKENSAMLFKSEHTFFESLWYGVCQIRFRACNTGPHHILKKHVQFDFGKINNSRGAKYRNTVNVDTRYFFYQTITYYMQRSIVLT